ncbi:MAG: biotin/lipoyl-containing protein, partial [Anaerolineae bacterium]
MAIEVYIPKFGQTVEEVTLLQWLVEDGAPVKKGQEILEIETDKTTFFVEAEESGYLHRGPFEPGQVVPILTVVATIGAADEKFVGGKILTGEEAAEEETKAEAAVAVQEKGAESAAPAKIFASPRARRLAAQEHVDLAAVTPTGGGGVRVVERDVRAYLESAPKATPLAEKLAA